VRWALAGFCLWAGCRQPEIGHEPVLSLRADPASLDFGRAWVGFPVDRTVSVSNPNRADSTLTPSITGPFALPSFAPVWVGGGSSVDLTVRFDAAAAGSASGQLLLSGVPVALAAEAVQPGPCAPSSACIATAFDADAGSCLSHPLADGIDCTASYSCFVSAHCEGGTCVGTLTTCDDGDPCTIDVCGPQGCTHLDGLPSCPRPADPCRVATCTRDAGCGDTGAPDGVACGPASCSEAHVCIAGQCVTRTPPMGVTCLSPDCVRADAGCGAVPASDGGVALCGTCPNGDVCDRTTRRCITVPQACVVAGAACGDILDACGLAVTCPNSCAPMVCAGNTCGDCVPATCPQLGYQCGTWGDGCGAVLQCGGCGEDVACVSGKCSVSCQPITCAEAGATCGIIGDGCGAILNCGTCPAPLQCATTAGWPTCDRPEACRQIGAECGMAVSACGPSVDCGPCANDAGCVANHCQP
jgi:hypothetical protein